MKKVLLFILISIPFILNGQGVLPCALPTATSTSTASTILMSEGACVAGSTKKRTIASFISTYSFVTSSNLPTASQNTVTITSGVGISVTGSYPSFTVTNSDPDQTVTFTSVGSNTMTGTYPNFTLTTPVIGGSNTGDQTLSLSTNTLTLSADGYVTFGVANGSTGLYTYTVGDILYASAATTLTRLPSVAVGSYLRSGGVSTAPSWSTLFLPNTVASGNILYATAANAMGSSSSLTYASSLLDNTVSSNTSFTTFSTLNSSTGTAAANNIQVNTNGGGGMRMTQYNNTFTTSGLLIGGLSQLSSNSAGSMGILFNTTQASTKFWWLIGNATVASNENMRLTTAGLSIMTQADPTAYLHIKASTASASSGQIKLEEGTRQTTPENGTINYVSNNLEFVETSTVYILAKTLTGTATLDFPSTLAGTVSDLTLTVTGAADGDVVSIGVPNGSFPATGTFQGWVSAANTVTVRYANNSLTLSQDPASGTFRASVIKY